jgi:hypothetical protein
MKNTAENAERQRLNQSREKTADWRAWGPYLSERQWATVREDYSADGSAWEYFPYEASRSRAYRWGEDGLLGISDQHQYLCLSLAFWNGEDETLKERAFGLTGKEGNHGEDLKEYYFYLDNLPSHAYMRALYKYPHSKFPYENLRQENQRRTRLDPEYELLDTGIFDDNKYFDIFATYAKASPQDILLEIEVANRADVAASVHILPTLFFRNTWSWKHHAPKPSLHDISANGISVIATNHEKMGQRWLYAEAADEILFTENETNNERIFKSPNLSPYVKDGIDERVVGGNKQAVNPAQTGTKASPWYKLDLGPKETRTIRLRLSDQANLKDPLGAQFTSVIAARKQEADEFYTQLDPFPMNDDTREVQRQAFAGLLWSKQFYQYIIRDWLIGDETQPPPPPERLKGRNNEWFHLYNDDILVMPDTWEYPWYASWDHAFHMISLAMIDPDFAKQQLIVLTREWYMHPNGQIPAYEWSFSDANPPVQAWAALRVFRIDEKLQGKPDHDFLERTFQKLLLNFTWWVNRKDANGNNIFQGGFLGLDNIGVFNRSTNLPDGSYLNQSDGTSWMAFYSLNMLSIALELAPHKPAYEDIATKFFEHFLYIADAMNSSGKNAHGLWDDEDAFYLDMLTLSDGTQIPLQVHSLVGLIPLLAVETLDPQTLEKLPEFEKRLNWFIKNRPDLNANVASMAAPGLGERRILAIADEARLRVILEEMLDEEAFLSPYGLRSLSRRHLEHPYVLRLGNDEYRVDYEPAESTSPLFGGNSNWRGPIWFPLNYLLIEALQRFYHYYGEDFQVEFPTGSGRQLSLWDIAGELSQRLISLFTRNKAGERPVYGKSNIFQNDPFWRDHILFYEHFHGDNGSGLGASHQTGWTALVAKLIQQHAEYQGQGKKPEP